MKNSKPVILLIVLLCFLTTACTPPQLTSFISDSDSSGTEAKAIVSSQQDIIELLLQAMYNNKKTCVFNVPDKSYINADYWLEQLCGLNSVHCEYRNWGSFCQVTASIEYWDNYPIVNAFKTGNTSLLNSRQLQMYNRYCDILHSQTSAANTDVKNELAIHDYIISNVEYVLDRDSKTPAYDALFKGTTSCAGYTEVFQTLMDMLGIQCISITGVADGDNHIWNMVCIDNEWYHVDTTWDDPINGGNVLRYNYFNITDDDIMTDHTISSEHPAAISTRLAYYNILSYPLFSTQSELNTYIASQVRARAAVCRFQTRNLTPDITAALKKGGVSVSYRVSHTDRTSYSTYVINFEYH